MGCSVAFPFFLCTILEYLLLLTALSIISTTRTHHFSLDCFVISASRLFISSFHHLNTVPHDCFAMQKSHVDIFKTLRIPFLLHQSTASESFALTAPSLFLVTHFIFSRYVLKCPIFQVCNGAQDAAVIFASQLAGTY